MKPATSHTTMLLSVPKAAASLGVSARTVNRWVEDGILSYCKLGKSVRIPAETVARFLEKSTRKGMF